jgi:CheY-like chemotaxis protein
MVHGLAAQSGGQFLLHSRQGVGTVAELWLPLADTAEATAPAAARAEPGTARPAHRRTVLLVDDDELVLASTAAILEDLGYRVIEAASGQQALKLLEASMQVDIVVTDYAMPGMTGLQLVEELHRIRPRLAVLLATGYAELPGVEGAELPRLAKPFGQAALVQAIEACFAIAS